MGLSTITLSDRGLYGMNTEVVLEAGIRTEESLRMVERGGSRVMEKLGDT